jgi:hypothetical protein
MTTYRTSIVAGVFQDEAQARHAVDQLRSAGFAYDQVGVARHNGAMATQSLRDDLLKLGVPEEQANYYDNEYRSGRIVVSVRPDGREAEVENILRSNGAYDFNASNNPAAQSTNYNQPGQRPDTEQPGTYPPGPQQAGNYGQQDYRQESDQGQGSDQ